MDRHQRNSTVLTHSFPTRRASDLARPRDREARRLRLDRADRQIARARGRGGEIVALDAIDRQVPRSGDRGAAEGGHRHHDLDRAALVPTPGNAVAASAELERVAVADDLELVEQLGRPGRLDRQRGADAARDTTHPPPTTRGEAGAA